MSLSQKPTFLGSWLVSEYIYNSDGRFAGINRQKRQLHKLENGSIRVTQICDPEESLKLHPMGRFAGEWVFDLEVDGRLRKYLGPDVIGNGISWGDGAMTGRGIWPRFGYGFSSFAVLPSAVRQLTGGRFQVGPDLIANIAGIAVPDDGKTDFPRFKGPTWPGDIAEEWTGETQDVSASGDLVEKTPVQRKYHAFGWTDGATDFRLSTIDTGVKVEGQTRGQDFSGLARRYGWLFEWEAVTENLSTIEATELLDPVGKCLVEVRKYFTQQVLDQIKINVLRPK